MIKKLKSSIISLTIFLFPLFFLPITHEFYNTNKVALLTFSLLLLAGLSLVEFLQSKKMVWNKQSLLTLRPMLTFLMVISVSTLLRSPNVVQSALDLVLGFTTLSTLTVFFWYLSQEDHEEGQKTHHILFTFSGLCVSLITLFFSFHPFKSASLPQTFQFLKNPLFTPVGGQKDLAVFLGFIALYQILTIIKSWKTIKKADWLSIVVAFLATISFTVTLFSIKGTALADSAAPLGLSIKTAVRSLSSPLGFFFGSGIDLFGTILTQVKDVGYQNSAIWQISSFDLASSALLHVAAEAGVLGSLALIWVFVSGLRTGLNHSSHQKNALLVLLAYMAVVFVTTPPSLMLFFLLYTTLGFYASDISQKKLMEERSAPKKFLSVLMSVLTLLAITLLISIGYGFTRVYQAEMAMRNSIEAVAYNDLNKLYNEQRNAVVLNPYIERYRLNFSQTNLFIAKQLAAQTQPNQSLITRSVQAAINEAQAAVALNPKRASNWENLGIIYKNVLGVKDADKWSISSYQRAILLDPQNVSYRIGLGGVYYSLAQYENAIKMFNEVILMKPDLGNAYYNLAYAYYQNKNPQKAVQVMNILLAMLKNESSSQYQKVLKERNAFQANSPDTEAPAVIQ